MKNRYAGILLPITALPTAYGVGSLGKEAKNFVDFLALKWMPCKLMQEISVEFVQTVS